MVVVPLLALAACSLDKDPKDALAALAEELTAISDHFATLSRDSSNPAFTAGFNRSLDEVRGGLLQHLTNPASGMFSLFHDE